MTLAELIADITAYGLPPSRVVESVDGDSTCLYFFSSQPGKYAAIDYYRDGSDAIVFKTGGDGPWSSVSSSAAPEDLKKFYKSIRSFLEPGK